MNRSLYDKFVSVLYYTVMSICISVDAIIIVLGICFLMGI